MTTLKNENRYTDDVRLALLEQSINNINNSLVRFEKRFDQMDEKFDRMESKFDRMDAKFHLIETPGTQEILKVQS